MPLGVARGVMISAVAQAGTPGSTGFVAASGGVNINDGGATAWVNPGNITALDGARATATSSGTGATQIIYATFSGLSVVPVGATITGVIARVHRDYSAVTAQTVLDHTVRLTKDGTNMVGDNKADTATGWPQSGGTNNNYAASDDLWGTTLTAAEVKAVTFGLMIKANHVTGTASTTARIDAVWMDVHYMV